MAERIFTPLNGCAGVTVTLNTSTSTHVPLPVAPAGVPVGSVYKVNNIGVNYGFLALGDTNTQATTGYMAIAPGADPNIPIQFAGSEGAPTYAAGISVTGPTTFQITLGFLS